MFGDFGLVIFVILLSIPNLFPSWSWSSSPCYPLFLPYPSLLCPVFPCIIPLTLPSTSSHLPPILSFPLFYHLSSPIFSSFPHFSFFVPSFLSNCLLPFLPLFSIFNFSPISFFLFLFTFSPDSHLVCLFFHPPCLSIFQTLIS